MDFWMLRTFDQAGYYETRLILLALSLAIAGYFFYYKRDRRFLTIFLCGAALHAITQFALQISGLRGETYQLAIFGVRLPALLASIYQGLTEGGVVALFAFWFADLRSSEAPAKSWIPFGVLGAAVAALSFIAGWVGTGSRITSQRPMFQPQAILAVTAIIFISLWIAWRRDAISALVGFFMGLLIFAVLNYEPLHLLGVRYIGTESGGQFSRASALPQIGMMLLSHIFEGGGGKLHYFILPFAAGLAALREKAPDSSRERYSTQHLQDLAQRGWRKRSKPFTKP
jgi:hypothetical protein